MRPMKSILISLIILLLPALAMAAGTATPGPTVAEGPFQGWNYTFVSSSEVETVAAVPATYGKQICFAYQIAAAGDANVTLKSGSKSLMTWSVTLNWGKQLPQFPELCTASGAALNVTNDAAQQIYVGIIWKKVP